MIAAQQFSEPLCFHGEGAVWFEDGLRCVDMFAGDVLSFADDGNAERTHVGDTVAMVRPTTVSGMSIVARRHDVALWDEGTGAIDTIAVLEHDDAIRLNEGGCSPDGSLYVGSMSQTRTDAGSLYRLTPHGRFQAVLSCVGVSNGIGFSPDGRFMYYADSPSGQVDRLQVQAGSLVQRETFAEIEGGSPDGLWVDEDGGVWVAVYGGGLVQRFLPDGRRGEAVSVPASQVTSCTFGGSDRQTLYITTSRENLRDDDEPLAGAVFMARPDVRGLGALPFTLTGDIA